MNRHGYAKKATILVVDDKPYNLTLMSNLLKDDYKVEIANGGEEALKIVASGLPFDLILLAELRCWARFNDCTGIALCWYSSA